MKSVFVVRMKGRGEASRSKSYTAMLGTHILTFSEGVCSIDDPVLAKFILSSLATHYSIESAVVEDLVTVTESFVKTVGPEVPIPKQDDIADLPSDEDLPGVIIGDVVDDGTAAPKTVVAVPKRKLKPKKKKGH